MGHYAFDVQRNIHHQAFQGRPPGIISCCIGWCERLHRMLKVLVLTTSAECMPILALTGCCSAWRGGRAFRGDWENGSGVS